jgi:two-component system sensor kinase FixL
VLDCAAGSHCCFGLGICKVLARESELRPSDWYTDTAGGGRPFGSGLFDMSTTQKTLGDDDRVFRRGQGLIIHSQHLKDVAWFCAFGAAFYIAYRYAMSFSQATASPFWFPDSVLLCALLMSRPRRWWIFILAPLPIRLFSEVAAGIPLWFLLATFALDSAKGLVAAWALRRFVGNPVRFESVREVAVFFLFAVLLVPAASAFGGAAVLGIRGADYWLAWERWFLGDALTQLVVTPAILYWIFGTSWNARMPDAKRRIEGGLLAVGLVVTAYLASNTTIRSLDFSESLFYAPVPFLFWAAIRFGMAGASGAVTVVAFFAVEAALAGKGPIAGRSPGDTALALQNFLLLRSAPLYLVAALTEQSRGVERRLRESEDRFRNIANAAPMLLWISNREKLCEFFNQGWLEFTGRSLEREIGTGWQESVHPEDVRRCVEAYHAAFDARQRLEIEYRLRRHDGSYRWILQRGVPRYGPNGDFVGYIGSAIDITDRKLTEENDRKLAHMQRLVVMGELSAAMAHEVRQPLTAILSNANAARMLLNSQHPPLAELREIVSDIRRDDLLADEVIGRIRDFLRKREPRMQPCDLNAAISDVLRLVAGDARIRHVEIRTELAGELPPVLGDRTQLQQVLLNLIVNGMDAMEGTPEPSRHLTVQTRPSDDGGIEVAVTDHGCGIASDDLERLFEPFFTTRKEGMGLGLSIAHSIIAAYRGRLWAENNVDGGATFRFRVPGV